MKIIQLKAENFKRLQAISITPQGNMIVIGGANAQGKSSTLDAIQAALAGGKMIPEKPIRDGALKAYVIVETDEYTVTRKFTLKGSQLEVTAKDGSAIGSPQTLLDKLVGKLSFDPLEFSRMKPTDQAATLKAVVGLDLSALEQERARKYDERTLANRDLKQVEAQVANIVPKAVPDALVNVAALGAELKRLAEVKTLNDTKRRGLAANMANADVLVGNIERAKNSLAELEKQAAGFADTIAKQRLEVGALVDPDENKIVEQLTNAETVNGEIRVQEQRRELEKKALSITAVSDALTARMGEIDAEKATKLAAAKFPIPGLAFTDSGVTFNDMPFEQCCDSEKLKVSVAMGLALNPGIKVLLVRDGSLLDPASLQLVGEMAAKADAQVWLERVSEGAECSVIISDGMVAEDRMQEGA